MVYFLVSVNILLVFCLLENYGISKIFLNFKTAVIIGAVVKNFGTCHLLKGISGVRIPL
jgi:hypothetical protein